LWCINNKDNNFKNYIFAYETTVRVLDEPLFQSRLRGSRASVPVSSKIKLKINIWGAISSKGPGPCIVIFLFYKFITGEPFLHYHTRNSRVI
jgi:hypothetical protein